MSEPVYLQLKSFPEIPFTIDSVSDKGDEIYFEISAKDPEKEHLMDSPEFKEELHSFLEELIRNALDRAEDLLKEIKETEEEE